MEEDRTFGTTAHSGQTVQNIYQMYAANGNRCGFTVRRDSWGRSSQAVIKSIGGQESGPLEGKPPYYKNQKVVADICYSGQWKRDELLSCPGNYSYTRIDDGPLTGKPTN